MLAQYSASFQHQYEKYVALKQIMYRYTLVRDRQRFIFILRNIRVTHVYSV